MINSNVVQMLKTFSREEFKEFGKFVASPFFNNRTSVVKFSYVLKEFYSEFMGKEITKQNLYKKVYHDKRYNDMLNARILR